MPETTRLMRQLTGARPTLAPELLAALAVVILAALYNLPFWRVVLSGRAPWSPASWSFAATTFIVLAALLFIPLMLLGTRRLLRPLLAICFLSGAAVQYFTLRYGVLLDTDMLRNALHTNSAEAAEFLSLDLLMWMLGLGLLPAAAVFWVRSAPRPWRQALLRRSAAIAAACALTVPALLVHFQDLSSVLRIHHELRFAINPIAPLWFTGRALWRDSHQSGLAHAAAEPAWRTAGTSPGRKPMLLVLVVGETARAANFSLMGYARPTNPKLADVPELISFQNVHACGTATEISLPCMFSPYGRAQYDENLIRSHDSLLHVLTHAGIDVTWLDNQSGCKGVCDGLPYLEAHRQVPAQQCADDECHDEILLSALSRQPLNGAGDRVVVLHQLGNHGPAYHRRYPAEFARFQPACASDHLGDCSQAKIVNAYDNAVLYTDHLLATLIQRLRAQQPERDVAMVYLSDHGESLGELGLYLHGMPYFMAPAQQLHVPMLWWIPASTADALGVDAGCIRHNASAQISHDNLYHSILGLLHVGAPSYRPERDLVAACRKPAGTIATARDGQSAGAPAALHSARRMPPQRAVPLGKGRG